MITSSAPIELVLSAPAGTLREAGGDRPVVLQGTRAWVVVSGRIDVFATRMEGGEPAGIRTHLFRVERGAALFGGAPGLAAALLAVGAPGTTLLELDRGTLRDAGSAEQLEAMLAPWVARLHGALGGDAPADLAEGVNDEAHALAPSAILRVAESLAWAKMARGQARLAGAAAMAVGRVVPLAAAGWVAAGDEGCEVRLVSTDALLVSPDGWERVWEGVDRLHAMVLDVLAARAVEGEAAERERIRLRARAGRDALSGALSGLAATMGGGRAASGSTDAAGALESAFRRVAEAQGIVLGDGPPRRDRHCRNPVEALARTHRLRMRMVALRGDWWRHDSGPILGFTGDERPVALLPVPAGYEAHDPAAGTLVRMDAEAAGDIKPFAVALYRPFAAEPVGLSALVRFSMRGSGRDLRTVVGVAAATAGLGMLTPLVIAALFNSVLPGAERSQLGQLVLLLLVAAAATALFQWARVTALLRIEARLGAAVQAAVWDRLLSLPLPFFRDYSAGDLASRAMGIEEIRQLLSGPVLTALVGGVFTLGNFALLFYYDRRLALVALAMVAAAGAASLAFGALQMRRQRAILALRTRTSGLVLQLLNGISKLRLAGAEAHAFERWARLFGAQRREQIRARMLGNAQVLLFSAVPPLCTMAFFAAAGSRLHGPEALPTGDFLGFIAAFSMVLMAVLTGSAALAGVLSALPLYEQVRPILHARPESHAGKEAPGELSGAVELQHVTFRYHAEGPAVLHDVSLSVRPGEFVAFVGPSGSGKSTLLRLLLGFEAPEAGSVAYDGHDMAGLDVEAVRRQVGTVLQSGRVMSGSVFENIAGSSPISHDDAWRAARTAGLEADLKEMPMGIHTVISDGGGTLSGGQRQRLMLARALVREPRILLLDEATSALDNRTQTVVSEGLARLKATRIVVAHRLSTVMAADRVHVLEGGSIVESGTYEELMQRRGAFYELARRQLA